MEGDCNVYAFFVMNVPIIRKVRHSISVLLSVVGTILICYADGFGSTAIRVPTIVGVVEGFQWPPVTSASQVLHFI